MDSKILLKKDKAEEFQQFKHFKKCHGEVMTFTQHLATTSKSLKHLQKYVILTGSCVSSSKSILKAIFYHNVIIKERNDYDIDTSNI